MHSLRPWTRRTSRAPTTGSKTLAVLPGVGLPREQGRDPVRSGVAHAGCGGKLAKERSEAQAIKEVECQVRTMRSEVIEKFGGAECCLGCTTAMLGGKGVAHSELCRTRMEKHIRRDPTEKERWCSASRKE